MVRSHLTIGLFLLFLLISACGRDDKSASDQDIQKALQEGVKKEKQLYEGMQKGAESLEKSVQEQEQKAKN